MKASFILRLSLVLVLAAFASLAKAQQPAASTATGYWNLETNLTTRNYTTVRFYNVQDQLVYEETLPNFCLDLSRSNRHGRRLTRQLDADLQLVLRDPAATQPNLLATQLGQSPRMQRLYAAR